MNAGLQYGLYLALLAALAWPLGKYLFKVMNGDRVLLTPVLRPIEKGIYRLLRIDENEDMGWKQYAVVCVLFNLFGFLALWAMQLLQSVLPLNPEGMPGTSWHLGFNTAASFMTNTNWQAYSGETTLSYFTQMLGLCVQNFVSPAVGIAVMFALIRGLSRVRQHGVGSFYTDMVRGVVYVLMPLALVLAMVQTSQGVIQNFSGHVEYQLLEPVTASVETELGDGTTVTQEVEVTKGYIPMGPASSQIAIKQLGTNGGGYNGLNSAHPLENPTPLSNLGEMLALLLIPAACCFAFGYGVKDKKQGAAIFLAMFILLVAAVGFCALSEHAGTPQLAQDGAVANPVNMEGKEARFGIPTSVTWATWTTAASNGSVNSMHDSYTPLGGLVPMLLMQLGEVVFGGVGCGLYGMIGFVILTVFIAGLMVGHTPEYLGKKIEAREMKMAVLVCLATPVACLIGAGIACMLPSTMASLNNAGAHGFSEVLYAYSSGAGNNGSAFAGFNANTPFLNVSIGLVMIFARFVPMLATLAIAGSMVEKKRIAESAGTLSTSNGMFVFLLIVIVLLVGALSFFPALALGPIAEHFLMLI
ncbi:MAG: potassium-transporting ATPase subunit KdpA [Aristaeellaceae bacterium]